MPKSQHPAQGFGPPPAPAYWVQVIYTENEATADLWVPIPRQCKPRHLTRREHHRHLSNLAHDAATLWARQPGVDFTLVLDGAVPEGGCPGRDQVIADFGKERGTGRAVYRLQTKAARSIAGLIA